MSMTKDAIRLCIKRHDSAHSIERMYLHHKGFTDIGNLEEFTQVRCLFLEANQLKKIENLTELKNLEILHIQKNKISKLVPPMSRLTPFSSVWHLHSHLISPKTSDQPKAKLRICIIAPS